jgi:hypothetical protein
MRRYIGAIALVVTCAAMLLIMSTVATARETTPTKASLPSAGSSLRSRDLPQLSQLAASSGAGVIRGTVVDYAGQPVSGAYLMWLTGENRIGDGAQTDTAGSYQITGVPALSGTGQLWMVPGRDADVWYFCRGLTFFDPGPTTFDFWPGRLPLTIQRGGPWAGGSWAEVDLFGGSGTLPGLETSQYLKVGSADTFTGYAYGLPGEYTSAVVVFRGGGWPARFTEAQEIEMPQGAPAMIESGQTGGVSLAADERDAVRAKVTRWASGAPGRNVILRLSNLRAGDVYKITGESMNGHEPVKTFGMVTVPSPAPRAMPLKVRVPLKVPTGDKYNFEATRVGSNLRLVASYQVCAFKASRHDITRGESVRLTGVVPLVPSDTSWNTKMDLTLFKHAGTVSQPWTWQAKGWTKVTTIRTDESSYDVPGWFSISSLHPRRTTSYVIRFPRSSDPSWRGCTSVETVHVH